MMKIDLVSQTDVLERIREYAKRYPLHSRDKRISDTGYLIREIMADVFQNVPVRGHMEENEPQTDCAWK